MLANRSWAFFWSEALPETALLAVCSPNILAPVPPGSHRLDLARLTASLIASKHKSLAKLYNQGVN